MNTSFSYVFQFSRPVAVMSPAIRLTHSRGGKFHRARVHLRLQRLHTRLECCDRRTLSGQRVDDGKKGRHAVVCIGIKCTHWLAALRARLDAVKTRFLVCGQVTSENVPTESTAVVASHDGKGAMCKMVGEISPRHRKRLTLSRAVDLNCED